MARGWAGLRPALQLDVFEPAPTEAVAGLIGAQGWRLNPEPAAVGAVDCLILSVKPQMFGQALEAPVRAVCGPQTLVISIMAGLSLARLREACGTDRVVRAMPNTPGQIGRGVTGWIAAPSVTPDDVALIEALLAPLGALERLATERQMDAVTAVSGSGPAYLFLLVEALAAAGEAEGLDRGLADRLARATVTGSAALLDASEASPLDLRREVTSPGGTTAAAIDVLTGGGGLITLMRRAVEAAATRSRQLGR